MLKDLKILNGTLDLEFDERVYDYTVTVSKDIEKLDLAYKLADDTEIKIENNELNNKNNIVYLIVSNSERNMTYTLYVYKENDSTISSIDNYMKNLEINNIIDIDIYKVQILAVSLFLIIIIVFTLLFKKKKIK